MGYFSELDIRLRNIAQLGYDPCADDDLDQDDAAAALGGEVDGKYIHCPSPGYGPDDRSMHVIVNDGVPYIYECNGSLGKAYAHVRAALGLPDQPRTDYTAQAQRVWDETIACAPGGHVERYLRNRAITLPVPVCLRYHEQCWHNGTRSHWPAMIAERTDVNGVRVAVHRTYLSSAAKAPVEPAKMDLGPVRGTAIRLAPVAEELMVGEGIETVLSAMQSEGLPGWAAGSAIAMRMLVLPAAVRSVIILADGDDAGRDAARSAATRWQREGRRVRIATAPPGKDFNDVLRESVA